MDDGLESIVQSFERGGSLVFQIIPCHDKVIRSESFFLFFFSLSPPFCSKIPRTHCSTSLLFQALPEISASCSWEGGGGISFTLSPSSISVNEKESGEGKRHYSGPKYRDYTIVEKSEIYPGLAIRSWKSAGKGKIGNFAKTCANANSSLTYGEPPDDQSGIKFSGECVYPAAYRKWNR